MANTAIDAAPATETAAIDAIDAIDAVDDADLWHVGLPPAWLLDDRLNEEYDYISDDGFVMPASQRHRDASTDLAEKLHTVFAERGLVATVNEDIYFRWDPRRDRRRFAPDLFVVLGVPQQYGPHYHAWEFAGQRPSLAVELGSPATRGVDVDEKREGYGRAGIPHYVFFDLSTDANDNPERLRVWELRDGAYQAATADTVDGQPRWWIDALQLWVADGGPVLDLFHPDGRRVLTRLEQVAAERKRARAETVRANTESARADQQAAKAKAEAERADQQAAKAKAEADRADQLAAKLQAEADRADEERRQRQALEAELAAMKAALANRSADNPGQ